MSTPKKPLSREARRLNDVICRYKEAKQAYRDATIDMREAVRNI